MRTVYREKRYYCGEYLDVYIYPTYAQARSRGKRSKPTSAAQAKLNQRHREEKLVRLLHANFTPDDLEIHLTYQDQPETPEEAQRLLRNYIRRVQRARKKQGLPPLKYIAVTEKGSKNGRYHHHVTLSGGMDRDELEKLWGLGYANSRRLQFTESGLAGLGHYIVKGGIDRIERKQDAQDERYISMAERVTAVESSAKQAHHRIDRLEAREPREEG